MAVIYREITGSVVDAQGNPLAAGALKVKPRSPIIQGANFIAPRMSEVPVVDGEFTLSLAAPSLYEFLVQNATSDTIWNFQSPLSSNTSKPISLAELWTNREDEFVSEEPYDITRVKGDTYALRLWLVDPDNGGALDLNNADTVTLTVDEREEPDDESTVVFQLVGQVIDPDKGIVDFPINATQANNLGDFFYNVTVVYLDTTVSTVSSGPFTFVENIAESETFTWVPASAPADGAIVPADGSDTFVIAAGYSGGADLAYGTVDGRRIIEIVSPADFRYWGFKVYPTPQSLITVLPGWYVVVTCYLDQAELNIQASDPAWTALNSAHLNLQAAPDLTIYSRAGTVAGELYTAANPVIDPTGWTAGWYEIGLRMTTAGGVETMVRPESGLAYAWEAFDYGAEILRTNDPLGVSIAMAPIDDPTARCAISEVEWGWS